MNSEKLYQCPLCKKKITLSIIGRHYHRYHPWAKRIPKIESLHKVSNGISKTITDNSKNKRSEVLKSMRKSTLNKPYSIEDLKQDNIKKSRNHYWPKK